MAKAMKKTALLCVSLTVFLGAAWYIWRGSALFSAAVAAATTAHHFLMRLAVGAAVDGLMGNRANYRAWWYRPRRFEERLYAALRVKAWKKYLPTYDPGAFSVEGKSLGEIAQAMCQAEIVHELIIVLSFLPLLAAKYVGDFPLFLLSSLAAALFDLLFVMLQRYNRPRLVRLAERKERKRQD